MAKVPPTLKDASDPLVTGSVERIEMQPPPTSFVFRPVGSAVMRGPNDEFHLFFAVGKDLDTGVTIVLQEKDLSLLAAAISHARLVPDIQVHVPPGAIAGA